MKVKDRNLFEDKVKVELTPRQLEHLMVDMKSLSMTTTDYFMQGIYRELYDIFSKGRRRWEK